LKVQLKLLKKVSALKRKLAYAKTPKARAALKK
jgi:hypothetical protein